jgi:5-methylcytosine-specific restriction endonuclease McrA
MVYFGNAFLLRSRCSRCKSSSIIIDGKYSCCGKKYKSKINGYIMKREIIAELKRRKPSAKKILKILINQEGKCFYCKEVLEKPICDHFVPYSFSQNNNIENFVISCERCNQIKHNKIFYSVEDAKNYINNKVLHKRKKFKGLNMAI